MAHSSVNCHMCQHRQATGVPTWVWPHSRSQVLGADHRKEAAGLRLAGGNSGLCSPQLQNNSLLPIKFSVILDSLSSARARGQQQLPQFLSSPAQRTEVVGEWGEGWVERGSGSEWRGWAVSWGVVGELGGGW